jgi:hypothetical protein
MPFSEYQKAWGGREYRGLRTARYTYVRDINGPWLLFDNLSDPYQMNNMCDEPAMHAQQEWLDRLLLDMLLQRNDEFLPGVEYMKLWGYPMDSTGAVPFDDFLYKR